MKINFTCPECGSSLGIEQVVTNPVVVSQIYEIEPDGSMQTDVQAVLHGESTLYECRNCGRTVGDNLKYEYPSGPIELFTWLQQRGMVA